MELLSNNIHNIEKSFDDLYNKTDIYTSYFLVDRHNYNNNIIPNIDLKSDEQIFFSIIGHGGSIYKSSIELKKSDNIKIMMMAKPGEILNSASINYYFYSYMLHNKENSLKIINEFSRFYNNNEIHNYIKYIDMKYEIRYFIIHYCIFLYMQMNIILKNFSDIFTNAKNKVLDDYKKDKINDINFDDNFDDDKKNNYMHNFFIKLNEKFNNSKILDSLKNIACILFNDKHDLFIKKLLDTSHDNFYVFNKKIYDGKKYCDLTQLYLSIKRVYQNLFYYVFDMINTDFDVNGDETEKYKSEYNRLKEYIKELFISFDEINFVNVGNVIIDNINSVIFNYGDFIVQCLDTDHSFLPLIHNYSYDELKIDNVINFDKGDLKNTLFNTKYGKYDRYSTLPIGSTTIDVHLSDIISHISTRINSLYLLEKSIGNINNLINNKNSILSSENIKCFDDKLIDDFAEFMTHLIKEKKQTNDFFNKKYNDNIKNIGTTFSTSDLINANDLINTNDSVNDKCFNEFPPLYHNLSFYHYYFILFKCDFNVTKHYLKEIILDNLFLNIYDNGKINNMIFSNSIQFDNYGVMTTGLKNMFQDIEKSNFVISSISSINDDGENIISKNIYSSSSNCSNLMSLLDVGYLLPNITDLSVLNYNIDLKLKKDFNEKLFDYSHKLYDDSNTLPILYDNLKTFDIKNINDINIQKKILIDYDYNRLKLKSKNISLFTKNLPNDQNSDIDFINQLTIRENKIHEKSVYFNLLDLINIIKSKRTNAIKEIIIVCLNCHVYNDDNYVNIYELAVKNMSGGTKINNVTKIDKLLTTNIDYLFDVNTFYNNFYNINYDYIKTCTKITDIGYDFIKKKHVPNKSLPNLKQTMDKTIKYHDINNGVNDVIGKNVNNTAYYKKYLKYKHKYLELKKYEKHFIKKI